jgi:hypothetical protein
MIEENHPIEDNHINLLYNISKGYFGKYADVV